MITKLENFLNENTILVYEYRFKTKKEFIDEYGENWRGIIGFNTSGGMDHLIGTPINVPPSCIDENGDVYRSFDIDEDNHSDPRGYWSISRTMVKKIKKTPQYQPKKFIYESNTKKYTYRFKTEKEFRHEYGDGWRRTIGFNPDGGMDYLIGTYIDVPPRCLSVKGNGDVVNDFFIRNSGSYEWGDWQVMPRMLKKENATPQYQPKKFIYESKKNEYTYRFKTEEEYEKEAIKTGRSNWRGYAHFNDQGDMDYLLNSIVDVPESAIDKNGDVVREFQIPNTNPESNFSKWVINPHMVKKDKSVFNLYRPKKFVYENNEPIKTKRGTVIKRYKDVGKKMGDDLYFHKKYVDEYIDKDFYNELKSHLPKGFKFTVIKYNKKNETVSFIYSPDFNTADEPIVSDAYKVTKDGKVTLTREKSVPQIYHHKWLFVKDDYKGFIVGKSMERSKEWLVVSDQINMSKIGSKGYWEEEVLPLLEGSVWSTKKQQYTSAKTSINQIPKPVKRLLNANELKDRSVNLDIGGGKYDTMSDYLARWGLKNYVYDPYNRSKEHNRMVIEKTKNGHADSVTIFNVLNVIKEKENQIRVLKQAKNALKKGGKVFIYSNYYVKDKKPGAVPGRDSYQQYYKLKDTLPIIQEVFPRAELNRKLLCVVSTK